MFNIQRLYKVSFPVGILYALGSLQAAETQCEELIEEIKALGGGERVYERRIPFYGYSTEEIGGLDIHSLKDLLEYFKKTEDITSQTKKRFLEEFKQGVELFNRRERKKTTQYTQKKEEMVAMEDEINPYISSFTFSIEKIYDKEGEITIKDLENVKALFAILDQDKYIVSDKLKVLEALDEHTEKEKFKEKFKEKIKEKINEQKTRLTKIKEDYADEIASSEDLAKFVKNIEGRIFSLCENIDKDEKDDIIVRLKVEDITKSINGLEGMIELEKETETRQAASDEEYSKTRYEKSQGRLLKKKEKVNDFIQSFTFNEEGLEISGVESIDELIRILEEPSISFANKYRVTDALEKHIDQKKIEVF